MTETEAIAALDAINGDPETMHVKADEVLLKFVPPAIREAYERAVERSGDWWFA